MMRLLSVPRAWLVPLLALEAQLALALPALQQQQPLQSDDGVSSNGAVACESSICSKIGIDLMRRGGNAADAMVGTTLCVGVIGMYHSGIGGGGFMLVRSPAGEYEVVDFRETAPAAAHKHMYDGNNEGALFGGLAVAIPGELRGLEYLHQKYGSLPWEVVVTPAVHVARDGFPVSEDLVKFMTYNPDTVRLLVEDPVWAQDFAPNGTLLQLGDTITRARYADTLEQVAKHGADVFYSGPIAESMVEAIQASNGTATLADFAGYAAIVRAAVQGQYRGRRLFATGAPSSGAVTLSVLQTLDEYPRPDATDAADADADTNVTTHRFDEALRFGYGARTHLGDPAYVAGAAAYEAAMLTAAHAATTRRQIRDDRTLPVAAYNPAGSFASPSHGTSHVSTADRSGLAVSSTTTINTIFGSRLMDAASGVILNNEMCDFSIPGARDAFGYPPSPGNYARPGKRPLSSTTPLMAEEWDPTSGSWRLALVTGAAGGSRIISATAQVVWHVLEHGLGIAAALAMPRLHDQLAPNQVVFEAAYDNRTVTALAARGHHVAWTAEYASAAQGIQILPGGRFDAAGEPRQKNSGGEVF
ncbi:gamma-glutamyltranspeptidase [Grosmannia clavigera kw1407]|uniref:Glutathione hydrolase n=1 Tax=Grosmannia clavigera (strain kw1407 / UAMH 11150) TaxID=655863 RepID=F0X7E8_GROCL|nr:gamma-glutamyltranspeptidase [Grosmannia clavigera kw1407]EFX06662.1 gamma-glutamyltranspeptidase [Grosmannia clavigera kw1407]